MWSDLLARLSLAAVASTQAQARFHLRTPGVRRTGTVTTNLAREFLITHRMAVCAGVWAQPLVRQTPSENWHVPTRWHTTWRALQPPT